MRAVVITRPGGPEVLAVQDRAVPEPGAGDARVRIAGSGINRADLLQRQGRYPAPAGWPADIPGLECAGVVDAVGPGVERWSAGDAVMGILGGGGYAECVVTRHDALLPVPERIGVLDAAAIPEVFLTAFDAVWLQAGLSAGETVLIHAAGSGVGTAAVQMAAAFGAVSIGTSRTAAKLDRAEALGMDHGIPSTPGWPDRVLEATGGRGVDVILDLVGGNYLAGNQRVLAERGRHVVVGVPGGASATIDLRALMGRRATLRGTVLRPRSPAEKADLTREFETRVLPHFEQGRLRPVIECVLEPERAPEAHRLLEDNATFGKVLLRW